MVSKSNKQIEKQEVKLSFFENIYVHMLILAYTIIFFVLIIGVPYFVYDWGIEEYIQLSNAIDNSCINDGFNESTDYKSEYDSHYGTTYLIECDYNTIREYRLNEYCSKYNKWNECTENDYTPNRK